MQLMMMNNTRNMMTMCSMASSVFGLMSISNRDAVRDLRPLSSSSSMPAGATALKPIQPAVPCAPPTVVSAYIGTTRLSRSFAVSSCAFTPISAGEPRERFGEVMGYLLGENKKKLSLFTVGVMSSVAGIYLVTVLSR